MIKLCLIGSFIHHTILLAHGMQLSKSYIFSVNLAEKGPKYEYCGRIEAAFGSTDFGKVKYRTGKLLPGAEYRNQVIFAKEMIDFDPEKVSEVSVTWDSGTYMAFSSTCKPDNVTNEGKSINVVGVEMEPRGMFKGPREGDNEYTVLLHGESVVFKL